MGTSHLDLEAKLYRWKWLQLPQQIHPNPLPWDKKVMVQCSAEHHRKGREVFKGRWIHFKLKYISYLRDYAHSQLWICWTRWNKKGELSHGKDFFNCNFQKNFQKQLTDINKQISHLSQKSVYAEVQSGTSFLRSKGIDKNDRRKA